MKKICVVTATRAEYGLLKPLIRRIRDEEGLELLLVVTGAHLSKKYGETVAEIREDGFLEYVALPMDLSAGDAHGMAASAGGLLAGFSRLLLDRRPDLVVLLGDRYELMAVAMAATIHRVPLAHIHGGETTEGAVDEAFRHAITKMSYLHFASAEPYRRRIIQLGESPDRVYNVGALGAENIRSVPLLSQEELEKQLSFPIDRQTVLVTYHPVTLEASSAAGQLEELLAALQDMEPLRAIFTKANADAGGDEINRRITGFVAENSSRYALFASLGQSRYLSALQYVGAVVGNSSSGVSEVPFFGIPTVNIGDRQRGRLQASTVINCPPERAAIGAALRRALQEPRRSPQEVENPYAAQSDTSREILQIIKKTLYGGGIELKKTFYDLC